MTKTKTYNGKPVKLMQWEVYTTEQNPNSHVPQVIASVSEETVKANGLIMHKRHKSRKHEQWYYLDSRVPVPSGNIRVIETRNPKTGHIDYIYDPDWFPCVANLEPSPKHVYVNVKNEYPKKRYTADEMMKIREKVITSVV